MNTYRGFSLTEVLIALFLITSTSLGLITQQCHTSYLSTQLNTGSKVFTRLANTDESFLADFRTHKRLSDSDSDFVTIISRS